MSKQSSLIILSFFCILLPIYSTKLAYDSINETWRLLETSTVVEYSEGAGYGFILIMAPFLYITFFPKFIKFQKIMAFIFTISVLIGLLITPRVIDYITEQKLIDKGYTYCDYKRIGSVRHMKRIWQLDPTCQEEEKIQ